MVQREHAISGKVGALIGLKLCVPLLFLASAGSAASQDGLPNLRPVRPDGWSDSLVVSNRQETHTDTLRLMAYDRLFVDFAVINSGGAPAAAPFRIELFLDGRLRETFDVAPPLDPQVFRFREDYPIGRLSSGTHTLRLVVDGGEAIPESDESDNQYTKTFFVSGACFPLTTRVSPRGAGTVAPSREPNCGSATLGVRSPGADDRDSNQELGMGGEPILKAQRDRAFAALRAKVQAEGKARVIVGLRTEGRSVSASVSSLNEAQARSPLISRVQQSLLTRMVGYNLSSVRRFKYIPHVAVEVDGAALEALASDPEVVTLEEDIRVEPVLEASTALVGAPNAWSQGYSGAGQTVAILDTGVDGEHPFLKGRVVSEACYSGGAKTQAPLCPGGVRESTGMQSGEPCSSAGICFHGTAVAGVASGGGTEFSGVAPDSGIIAIQVFSECELFPNCLTSVTSDWVAGLERVLELSGGFDIAAVNMSFSGRLFSEDCDADFPAVKAAMDNLRAFGIAPVAASGNKRSSTGIDFPSCISSAVSVGSTDTGADETTADEVSSFSNSSPLLDLLAPGGQINTSVPGEGFGRYSGTSFSAPHVTGAWAVLKSKAPNASVPDLLSALKSTGAPILDPRNQLIKPRIQVDAALDKIVKELPYSTGTRMTLTAQPNPGFRFQSWRGCDSESENQCTVQMNTAKNIVAIFQPITADPDLIITSLVAPPTATIGGEVSISSGIRNQGRTGAGPFRLGFYLSVDPTITTEDTWFAACSYDSGLPAGESALCNRFFPLPPRVGPGNYFLGAVVDDLDQVAENSETNNARASDSRPIEVLAPTLSSRSFVPVILTAAGLNNSYFSSELTLTNRGTQEARIEYIYEAHKGSGKRCGFRCHTRQANRQIEPDAFKYLRRLDAPHLPRSATVIGTLGD